MSAPILNPAKTSLEEWIRSRQIEEVECLVPDMSGVARGKLTEAKLNQIHDYLKRLLADEGAYLDGVYYCPFHPDAPVEAYRRESDLRKPAPGMLTLAADELDLDLADSWIVGDDDRDITAGRAASAPPPASEIELGLPISAIALMTFMDS